MQSKATSVDAYFEALPVDRKEPMNKLRKVIIKNLPNGYVETMNYGMPGYVIPHSLYPPGYHVNPLLPLGLLNIASQKKFIGLYHMGIYADEKLLNWFVTAYQKTSTRKLDMGKSCIRFKNFEEIPFMLIGELVSKLTVQDWINKYESIIKK